MNAPPAIDTDDRLHAPKRRGIARVAAFGILAVILGAFWVSTSTLDIGRLLPDQVIAFGQLVGIKTAPVVAVTPAQPKAAAAAPVRVGEASRRDLAVIRRTPGTVIANTAVQITSRVQGIIDA